MFGDYVNQAGSNLPPGSRNLLEVAPITHTLVG